MLPLSVRVAPRLVLREGTRKRDRFRLSGETRSEFLWIMDDPQPHSVVPPWGLALRCGVVAARFRGSFPGSRRSRLRSGAAPAPTEGQATRASVAPGMDAVPFCR
jgi:hypothetical protein